MGFIPSPIYKIPLQTDSSPSPQVKVLALVVVVIAHCADVSSVNSTTSSSVKVVVVGNNNFIRIFFRGLKACLNISYIFIKSRQYILKNKIKSLKII